MIGAAVDRIADAADRAPAARAAAGPRIVAILPRGEAIRNFVHSRSLDQLSQHADVTLLTVLPTSEYREAFERRYARVYELRQPPERWIVRIHRDLLEMAHGRWLWSEAARERWRLRDADALTIVSRTKRAAKKAAIYPFANGPGLAALSAAERRVSRWFRTSDEYVRLFEQLKPALVFNGSHVHSRNAVAAVEAAQWLGIPTATFLFSWDNLTSQGRILPAYDHYLVWNEQIRDQLRRIYPSVRADQITVTGTPQFDFHFQREFYWTREEFCRRVGADPSRRIVLYSTGMANHMPGEPEIVEGVATLLRDMSDIGCPQLIVRVYPKDRTGRFDALKRLRPDVIFPAIPWDPAHLTPRPEDAPLLTNMLRHADAGVNVASTMSLEHCMFDRPVVNVGYNPPSVDRRELDYARYYSFDHYKPLVENGAVAVAKSEEELGRLLRDALTDPRPAAARGRAFLASMFGTTLDGRSGERVADALLGLASR